MKLLVISLAGIGDTLFATPLIHELRANFPDATLDALVLWRGSRDVLEGNPYLSRVHQRNLITDSKSNAFRFLIGLRREGYDASFNTHPQSRIHYRLVARIIGARTRISHRDDNASLLDSLLANCACPQDYARHAIENNVALLDLYGVRPKLDQHSYELYLSPEEFGWAENFVEKHALSGRELFGIHVGSGGTKNLALRRWPLANFIKLVRMVLDAKPNLNVLLFGGPEEESQHARILAEANSPRVLKPETASLRQAAALVKRCRAFLSVDTALMHVAAAMRVRGQIVIETPTWNKPIEPHGNPFTLVQNPAVAGRNLEFYRYDGRGIRGSDEELIRCMEAVKVEPVFEAVSQALG